MMRIQIRRVEAAVARNFGRALGIILVVALLVSSSPTAAPSLVAFAKESEQVAVWQARDSALLDGLRQGLAYASDRYWRLAGKLDSKGTSKSPNSAPTAAILPAPVLIDAPTNLTVTATTSSSISLSWTPPSGSVDNYQIERSQSPTGPFSLIGTAPSASFNDTTVTSGNAYLYRVRAVSGGIPSSPSNMAVGTAITYTDNPISAGITVVKGQHITELRQSVNAVRSVAGLSAASWTDTSLPGTPIKAVHVQELRDKLAEALTALSVNQTAYTDAVLTPGTTVVKKVHIDELRQRASRSSSSSSGPIGGDLSSARVDPLNRTGGGGEDPLSRNFNWNIPLVDLPGRAGMDLNLSLSYNSLVWTKSGSFISFDDDHGFPSPGFRLGFPVIQQLYFNQETAKWSYLLITPNGSRVELRQIGTSQLYESADSSHTLLDATTSPLILKTVDGMQFSFVLHGSDFQCTKVKDRNGNFLTINYTSFGRIDTVIDTLSRTIKFNYDGNQYLTSITQTWTVNGSPATHTWASFAYSSPNLTIQTNFPGLTKLGPPNDSTIKVLTRVTLADNSRFDFEWTSWGQVRKVSNVAADGHVLNYRSYNLPTTTVAHDDCPRFTERRDWAEHFNRSGPNGAANIPAGPEQEVLTTYAIPVSTTWTMPDNSQQTGTRGQVTFPDNTYHKFHFEGVAGTTSGWRRGLTTLIDTYDSLNTLRKRTVTAWTQDNVNASYIVNPRLTETNIYDTAGPRRRTVIEYGPYVQWSLPYLVREYAADASTEIRHSFTDYNLSQAYLDRRIIGLVSAVHVTNVAQWQTKVTFTHDQSTQLEALPGPATQHDPAYASTSLTARGNVTAVSRWDVTDIINPNKALTSTAKYDTAGCVIQSIDASGHQRNMSYADAFSANGVDLDPALSFATYAYPSAITDADGFTSSVRYNYDFGAPTWKRTPMPNTPVNTPGPQQTMAYDSIGRILKITNLFNGSYTRYVYANSQNRVDTFTTILDGASEQNGNEARSFTITDGQGRAIAVASSHGSVFAGRLTLYDAMGRPTKQSNPTETNASGIPAQWPATGDDNPGSGGLGWLYTQQTYDWQGRQLITTNADGTTSEANYQGCGCAGGDTVTLTDEGTLSSGVAKKRQQKVYRDVLGRITKSEVYNWDGQGPNGTNGTLYSSTINTYNARDQLTHVRQFKGAGPSDPNDLSCQNNTLRLATDSSWKQTLNFSSGWEQLGFDDSSWSPSVTEIAHGGSPWNMPWWFPADTAAHWIWYYDSRFSGDLSTVYFRKTFVATSDSATLTIRADNVFTAYLNGTQVATGTQWQSAHTVPLSLTPGASYVLAVVVTNQGGPGGLAADLSSIGTMCEMTSMTYDGYGRLKTKHVPGQDANGATTYNYNNDDTISSIVDARGASEIFGYNNRHLVTGVSYTAPGGITIPTSVTYNYDGAGNRIAMTDALGSMSYGYDDLSRLTSETRNFADPVTPFLNGSFTLNYQYNWGGELKKITDHTNTTINYNYDKAGRMTGITGENNLYGNVSNYVLGASYRAWGGLKTLTYGNNYTTTVSYNARLMQSEFEVAGRPPQFGTSTVMKTQFSYYDDGTLKSAHDTLDERFDRAYAYQHTTLLKDAYSGSEARDYINNTTSGTQTGPYRQTYQQNVFGQLTQRDNRFWSQTDSFNASWANFRNQDPAFHYDLEGNLTQDRDVQYTYDAANRNILLVASASSRTITPSYDGDGRVIKRNETVSGSSTVKYFLRSSVLGGNIIEELSNTGQKTKGYVFAGRQVLAIQEFNIVKWRHENALTGSGGTSGVEGWFNPEAEPDPMGTNVGFEDPYINCCELPPPIDEVQPILLSDFGGSGRCTLDGISIDCGWAMRLMESGAAVPCPNNDCGPRTVTVNITYESGRRETHTGLTNPFAAFADGRSGFGIGGMLLPEGFSVTFRGTAAQAAANAFFSGMATGGFGHGVSQGLQRGYETQALIDAANRAGQGNLEEFLKKNPKCAEVLKGLTNKSAKDFTFIDTRQHPGMMDKTLTQLGGEGDITLGRVMTSAIAYTIYQTSTIYFSAAYWGPYQDDQSRQLTVVHEILSHGVPAHSNLSHAEVAERLGIQYDKPPLPPLNLNLPMFISPQERERRIRNAERQRQQEYERPWGELDLAASAAIDKWIANGCQN